MEQDRKSASCPFRCDDRVHAAQRPSITNKLASENVPNAVHVYDFPSPSETFAPRLRSILMHANPVLHTRWNPVRKGSLILCCGGSALYTWSDEWVGESDSEAEEEMAECIGVPTSMCYFSPLSLPTNLRLSPYQRILTQEM